jgi:hypothetical protein
LLDFQVEGKRFFTMDVMEAPSTPLKRKKPICTQPERREEKTEKIKSPNATTNTARMK